MNTILLETEELRKIILKSKKTISDKKTKDQAEKWLESYYLVLKNNIDTEKETAALEYLRTTSTNARLIRIYWLAKLNIIIKKIKKDKFNNAQPLNNNGTNGSKILPDELLKKIKKKDNKIFVLGTELNQNWMSKKCWNSCGILMRIILERSLDLKSSEVKQMSGLKNKINYCVSSNVFGKSVTEALKKLDNSTKITGDIVAHDSNILIIYGDIELAIIPFRVLLTDIF